MSLVSDIVFANLPFLDPVGDLPVVTIYEKQVQYMLQSCLKIADADVEDETKYTYNQISLIADVVTIMMIMRKAQINMDGVFGSTTQVGGADTFIKSAKAGSVETEFGLTPANANTDIDADSLIAYWRKIAFSKASQYGCMLPILTDALPPQTFTTPFVNVQYPCNPAPIDPFPYGEFIGWTQQ
jgi:hypothetical protein